ncbi:hypothetical protein [Streptomyces avicenniae]|uniref:hypothetical protein n=1 Tax=Streptomyces avicenniae TaxID=500153 RepID=UPI00069C2B11|nr:hypothetical protein [Streptomyces avicenniae]
MTGLPLPDDLRFPAQAAADVGAYEAYFRIDRAAPDLDGWTCTLLVAQRALLADLPRAGLGDRDRADLLTGMALLADAALTAGARVREAPPSPSGPGTDADSGHDDDPALVRWRLGHQIFHLQLTLMNTLLDAALAAAATADSARLVALIDRLVPLYDAATAAMTYAASSDPGTYRDRVRPTMEPPFVGPGFSGVFNREHREMARLMGALRRALKRLPEDASAPDAVHAAAARLRAAQARNRANHLRICEECVPGGVSLLRDHLDNRPSPAP